MTSQTSQTATLMDCDGFNSELMDHELLMLFVVTNVGLLQHRHHGMHSMMTMLQETCAACGGESNP